MPVLHCDMRTFLNRLYASLVLCGLAGVALPARAVAATPPDFEEVRELVRAHLPGATEADLDRASLSGLLESLRGKVRLLGASNEVTAAATPSIAKVRVFDGHVAYVRVAQVNAALPDDLRRQCDGLRATNTLIGLVLDLRFANGDDYAAAVAAADAFVGAERPLLDWGHGVVKSVENADAPGFPLAVLINAETTGAAEALAAVLREADAALILGGASRGAAMTTEDFPLKNGQRLRIATSPVKLGNGVALTNGVQPDIAVATTPEAERVFLTDPYLTNTRTNLASGTTNSSAATNRPTRRTRPNEADLVRARRDGLSVEGELALSRAQEPEPPVLRDPALARAVDVLKGLAVIRRARP